MNIAILFASFGPYHKARMEALSAKLQDQGSKLYCIRFTEGSDQYAWDPCTPGNAESITLSDSEPSGAVASLKAARRFFGYVREKKIVAALLPSYSPLPNLLCIFAAKLAGCRVILMCDSWKATEGAGKGGRLIKRIIFSLFDAALVAGTRHIEYAVDYGLPVEKVFKAYDVVDVEHFEMLSARWKTSPDIPELAASLPDRYFLNVGRFVPKKNLGSLIDAYAALAAEDPGLDVALVLVGDGECLPELREKARSHGLSWSEAAEDHARSKGPGIVRYPFQQISTTPLFFGRCEAFILPSLIEEWGLVVNEAMACGAPVIVSRLAGCAPDLVEEGGNGFTFDPEQAEDLKNQLLRFVREPAIRDRLGARGRQIIQNWTPATFANNAINSVNAALGKSPQSERAKVTFLVESLAVASGGTALEVATLARELSKNPALDVTVVTFEEDPPAYRGGEGVREIVLPRKGGPPTWPGIWRRMRELLADQDTVFVTGIWGPFDGLGLRMAWPERAKVYIRVCGMLEPYILNRNRWKKRLGRALWVNGNIEKADGMITNSTPETSRLEQFGFSTPLLRIPNGVTAPPQASFDVAAIRQKLGVPPESQVFLYLGRIHPKKGLHVLLDALQKTPEFSTAPQNAQLIVAGKYSDSEYQKQIEDKISAYGLAGRIHFIGEVSGEMKEEVFGCADVFILPSESEGLPNAVLESMARGLPVILTEGCNIPEIADYEAGKVVEFHAGALAAAVKWALQGNEVLEIAGNNARKLVDKQFNLSAAVVHYTEIISSRSTITDIESSI